MLALMHELIAAGMANKSFLDKYTFGFDALKNYILCSTDGVEKKRRMGRRKKPAFKLLSFAILPKIWQLIGRC